MKTHICLAIVLCLLPAALRAQDTYEIEQTIDQTYTSVTIGKGWDVRLVQERPGTASTVVISTPCAHYFEEGNEPTLATVSKDRLTLKANTSMPQNTVVELHLSEPLSDIEVQAQAALAIDTLRADDIRVSLGTGATLRMAAFAGGRLDIWASEPGCRLDLGDIEADRCTIHRGSDTRCNITDSDTARHIRVKRGPFANRMSQLSLSAGLGASFDIDNLAADSPYKRTVGFGAHLQLCTNDLVIGGRWSTRLGLEGTYHMDLTRNDVAASGRGLAIDDSRGGVNPVQFFHYWTIGVPLRVNYQFKSRTPIQASAGLTPLVNFHQRLQDDFGTRHSEHVSPLRPFNIRASVSLSSSLLLVHSVELYADLLPSYHSGLGLDGFHQAGISFHF